jgi:hypothetical protein
MRKRERDRESGHEQIQRKPIERKKEQQRTFRRTYAWKEEERRDNCLTWLGIICFQLSKTLSLMYALLFRA